MRQLNNNINEDFFDNIDTEEIIQTEVIDNQTYLAKHRLVWFPKYGLTIYPLSQTTIKKIEAVINSTRHISNVSFAISGSSWNGLGISYEEATDTNNPKDFLAMSAIAPPVAAGSPQAEALFIYFDYDESKKGDIKYMMMVLKEVYTTYIYFCNAIEVPLEYDKFLTYAPVMKPVEFQVALRYKLGVKTDYYALRTNQLSKDHILCVQIQLESIGCSFSKNDIENFQDNRYNLSKTFIKLFNSYDLPKSLLNKIKFTEDKKRKKLIVEIPEDISVDLKHMSLGIFKNELKMNDVELIINGNLVISTLDGYGNLRYIKHGVEHNCITVNKAITPKLIRYMLVSFYLNKLDLSHADVEDDIEIDLSYKLVMNHNIEFVGNQQIIVKNN